MQSAKVNMKKYLALVLPVVLLATLEIGCSKSTPPTAQNTTANSTDAHVVASKATDNDSAPADDSSVANDAAAENDVASEAAGQQAAHTASKPADDETAEPNREWNQWGGSPIRNNVPVGKNIPTEWSPGEISDTSEWQSETSHNIKWVARLGSQSYGNPVVADGKVFVGTNNGAGYLKRYPADVDLGCLLCFDEADGHFLWQHSSEKLPTGRVHDWPLQGICCAPLVEGDRLWFVTSRGEVACLDTEGFLDDENDGPFQAEQSTNKDEADVIWYLDMMRQLKVSQHNMCSCSVTSAGDLLFVNTSNGVDEGHTEIPSPEAPSFLCLDKNTGKVLWQDNSPGENILHGQWSSPAYAVIDGVPQVLFGGGDGWLRSFRGEATDDGKPELLWEFDCNPKTAKYSVQGRSTRNHIIGTPVIYENLVYIAVGEDPEHGEGNGHLWCIDPTKRGDVSSELAVKVDDRKHVLPKRRLQAVIEEDGEVAIDNPNSAAVWHYTEYDVNGDGDIADFEEKMHRTCGTVAIKDGLLFIPDFSGLFHCVDAKNGKVYWTHDLFAENWGSAMIVGDKVYVGDAEGKLSIFGLSSDPDVAMKKDDNGEHQPLHQIDMGNSVYSTPVVANNVLYVSNKSHLFAIVPMDTGEQAAAETSDETLVGR
ncbi:MAG TPA: PQQ-binding-like beta-propeller repeat protein [Pirellulales bacterium]|nr:PQQ-binding-like beta-propeller repeat protein [Pirellulales bacterium]